MDIQGILQTIKSVADETGIPVETVFDRFFDDLLGHLAFTREKTEQFLALSLVGETNGRVLGLGDRLRMEAGAFHRTLQGLVKLLSELENQTHPTEEQSPNEPGNDPL